MRLKKQASSMADYLKEPRVEYTKFLLINNKIKPYYVETKTYYCSEPTIEGSYFYIYNKERELIAMLKVENVIYWEVEKLGGK
jgi:hypothetical protein